MTLEIAYTKLAVIGGPVQRILYDSATNSLTLAKVSALSTAKTAAEGKVNNRSKQTQSQVQLNKKMSEIEKEDLAQIVVHNKFFETDIFYPPNPTESKQYTLHVLSVILDDKLHTVVWTDASRNVPTCLNRVVETLEEVARWESYVFKLESFGQKLRRQLF